MVEISLWASIAADDDVAQFEAYLEKYPDGHFGQRWPNERLRR